MTPINGMYYRHTQPPNVLGMHILSSEKEAPRKNREAVDSRFEFEVAMRRLGEHLTLTKGFCPARVFAVGIWEVDLVMVCSLALVR